MRYIFSLCIILFSAFTAVAQQPQQMGTSPQQQATKRVEIINSDFIKSGIDGEEKIFRFVGNVILGHNNIIMHCDSAYRFPSGKFEAYSNVQVVNGTTVITGDKMIYDDITNVAQVRGEIVYLTDGESTLRTTAVDYNTKEEVGFFANEGTIKDPKSLLECKHGYYYSKTKDFVFINDVQSKTENYTLTSDSMKYNTATKVFDFYSRTHIWSKNSYLYCDKGWYNSDIEKMFFRLNSYLLSDKQEVWADSIYYESHTKQGKLYRNIQLLDTVQRTIAFGDFSDFNMQTQNFEMTINPSILFYPEEKEKQKEDTIYLRADRLKSIMSTRPKERIITDTITGKTDSTYREVFGIKNVRLFRSDFQAACDSLYFGTLDSIWKMYHEPILWNNAKSQLSADTIKFVILNGKMNKVEFETNSMIIMPESDTSGYYNQIKGKNMTGHFSNNELRKLDVFGNIQTIFFSLSEQAVNFADAASMGIWFENRKVRRVTYYDSPKSPLTPLFMAKEEQLTLKGFTWHADKRPKSKEEILTRTIRPSKRAKVNQIQPPTFPITDKMNAIEEKVNKLKINAIQPNNILQAIPSH